jgi:hypothetical protein
VPLLQDWTVLLLGKFKSPDVKPLKELLSRMGAATPDGLSALGEAGGSAIGRRKRTRKAPSGHTLVVLEQHMDELDEGPRRTLDSLREARIPVVDKTWIFDTISHVERQNFAEYGMVVIPRA